MRKVVAVSGLAVSMVLGPALPALAQTDGSVENCGEVILRQTEEEVAAGGGPKEGIPAPTNCDHFFQFIGVIGNGVPPGLEE